MPDRFSLHCFFCQHFPCFCIQQNRIGTVKLTQIYVDIRQYVFFFFCLFFFLLCLFSGFFLFLFSFFLFPDTTAPTRMARSRIPIPIAISIIFCLRTWRILSSFFVILYSPALIFQQFSFSCRLIKQLADII